MSDGLVKPMRCKILLLVLALTTSSPLARGQTPSVLPDLPAPQEETIERFSEPSRLHRSRPIAEDAEAAEELEAHRRQRLWVRSEFLLWFIKPASLPPLVTTGSFTEARPGALGSTDTQILFGRDGMDYQDRTGGRFTVGRWLDDERVWFANASYFFVRGRAIGQSFSSPGSPVLAMPFFNTAAGNQDSSLVTFPGIASGSVTIDAPSFLQGADVNVGAMLCSGAHCRFEASIGFRYLNLQEELNINAVTVVQVAEQYQGFGIPFDGNTIIVDDAFKTRNHFYGGQLGSRLELTRGRWSVEVLGKVALGTTHQITTIRGSTNIDTNPTFAQEAGLYAVASNSGRFATNRFSVVPEIGATLHFHLTERLRLFGGYSFLYWTNVARPGDQVDQAVNPDLIPTSATYGAQGGALRPAFTSRSADFYAHGAHFGFEFRY